MSLSGAFAKVFLVIFFTERQFEELLISFIDALKLKLKYDKNEFKIVYTFFNLFHYSVLFLHMITTYSTQIS